MTDSLAARLRGMAELGAELGIDEGEFRRGLDRCVAARRVQESESDVLESLTRDRLADIQLALACDAGRDPAWRRLEGAHFQVLRASARRKAGVGGEEVAEEFLGYLAEPAPTGPGHRRIGGYLGSSRLRTWLHVLLFRRIADRARQKSRTKTVELGEIDEPGNDQPDTLAGSELISRTRAALFDGVSALTTRESLALRMRHAAGLDQREIAGLLGVGEPRVSALLAAARAKLLRALETALGRSIRTEISGDGDFRRAVTEGLREGLASLGIAERRRNDGRDA